MARTSRILRVPDGGYSWPELHDLLLPTLKEGLSALVLGSPGVGKSALAVALATDLNLPLTDIRLAQQDPADLGGIYVPDPDRTELRLLAPAWVRRVCDAPGFIFLDEINAGVTRLHQSVAYQIVLEHRVGPFQFHPDTVVLAAGNQLSDQALATGLSSALCNRFVHFELRVDAQAWLQWAQRAGIDPRILGYVEMRGQRVLFDRLEGEAAFPSPRSWEMASRLLRRIPDDQIGQAVAACVGVRAAQEFTSYLRLYRRLSPSNIICRGRMPSFEGKNAEPSRVHATVVAVADWTREHADEIADKQVPNIVSFLSCDGLDPELWFLFLKRIWDRPDLVRRLKALPGFRTLGAELVGLHAESYR